MRARSKRTADSLTRCGVYEPGCIFAAGEFHHLLRVKLRPALVERHPDKDAGIFVQLVHDFSPLLVVGGFHIVRERVVVAGLIGKLAPLGIARRGVDVYVSGNGRDVLPDGNANAVTVPVPAGGFQGGYCNS